MKKDACLLRGATTTERAKPAKPGFTLNTELHIDQNVPEGASLTIEPWPVVGWAGCLLHVEPGPYGPSPFWLDAKEEEELLTYLQARARARRRGGRRYKYAPEVQVELNDNGDGYSFSVSNFTDESVTQPATDYRAMPHWPCCPTLMMRYLMVRSDALKAANAAADAAWR